MAAACVWPPLKAGLAGYESGPGLTKWVPRGRMCVLCGGAGGGGELYAYILSV